MSDEKKKLRGTVYRVNPGSEEVLGRGKKKKRKSAPAKKRASSQPGTSKSGVAKSGPLPPADRVDPRSEPSPGLRRPSSPPIAEESARSRRSSSPPRRTSSDPSFGRPARPRVPSEPLLREETDPKAEVFRAYKGKSQRPVPMTEPKRDSREELLDQLSGRHAGEGRLDPEYERKMRAKAQEELEEMERSIYSTAPPVEDRDPEALDRLAKAGWEAEHPAIAAGVVAPSPEPFASEAPTEPRPAASPSTPPLGMVMGPEFDLDMEPSATPDLGEFDLPPELVGATVSAVQEGFVSTPADPSIPPEPLMPGVTRRRDTGRPTYEERLAGVDLDAVGTASLPPEGPMPGPPAHLRARKILMQLRGVGPEDEGAAVQNLIALGEAVFDEIVREWPGLLWFNRSLAHRNAPRGRDVSPLARALFAFGAQAVPTVLQLMRSADADSRYYASLVGLDLAGHVEGEPRENLLGALVELLDDSDVGARAVAGDAVHTFRNVAELGPTLRYLESVLEEDRSLPALRLRALQAFARLRAVKVIPPVIELLVCADRDVAMAARHLLRLLTATDQGPQPDAWRKWWVKNFKRGRLRWLLDGLLLDDEALRGLSHRELVQHVGVDPGGFQPELEPRDRKKLRRTWERVLRDRDYL